MRLSGAYPSIRRHRRPATKRQFPGSRRDAAAGGPPQVWVASEVGSQTVKLRWEYVQAANPAPQPSFWWQRPRSKAGAGTIETAGHPWRSWALAGATPAVNARLLATRPNRRPVEDRGLALSVDLKPGSPHPV